MDAMTRIEQALTVAIEQPWLLRRTADAPGSPPRLAAALRYAVFPGGARIRPRLCLAVACACGEDDPTVADAAAASIELLHCASLVHDDLPCFDDAPTRRGKPSVHRAFGERLAVLSGDALIVLAFQTLARGRCERAASSRATAADREPLGRHAVRHRGRSGLGMRTARRARRLPARRRPARCSRPRRWPGAAAAGAEPGPWRTLGERLGEAYQVADDIRDVAADPEDLGKPIGRDVALGRPSAAGSSASPVRWSASSNSSPKRSIRFRTVRALPDCGPDSHGSAAIPAQGARAAGRLSSGSAGRPAWRADGVGRRPMAAPAAGSRARPLACQPAFPALGGDVSADAADRAAPRARDCSTCAPASSIRRSCWPACACTSSTSCRRGRRPSACSRGRLSLSNDAAERLLDAAISLRLVAQRGQDRFGLGALGAAMVGNPAVAAMVEHHACCTATCVIRWRCSRGERAETELARYWPYAGTVRPSAGCRACGRLHRADVDLAAAGRG